MFIIRMVWLHDCIRTHTFDALLYRHHYRCLTSASDAADDTQIRLIRSNNNNDVVFVLVELLLVAVQAANRWQQVKLSVAFTENKQQWQQLMQ